MIAERTLYRTAEGRLCESTDVDVAFLVCAKGAEVPAEFVAQLSAPVAEPVEEEVLPVDDKPEPEPVEPEKPEPEHAPKKVRGAAKKAAGE